MIVPPAVHEGCALNGLLASLKSPVPNAEALRALIQPRRVKLLFFMEPPIFSLSFLSRMDRWSNAFSKYLKQS
jgi:hypothetical protein